MTNLESAAPPLVLTPSERVFLFGDRFTKPAGMLGYSEVVLSSGVKVGADELALVAIAAAYLACEQAGAVRFEERQGKALFGLVKTNALHVAPGQRPMAWPEGSLESWIVQGARSEPKVSEFSRSLLSNSTEYSPSQTMFGRLKAALAHRGVLHAQEKKTLKVFSSIEYTLPDHARAAAEQGGTRHVEAMLDACRQQRPRLWNDLTAAIRGAISYMTTNSE